MTDRMDDYRTRHPGQGKDFLVTWPPEDDRSATAVFSGGQSASGEGFHAGRLWAGGAATALVAGLLAIVGILAARGLFDVAVLAPKGEGTWGNANTLTYALTAALCAFAATGMMHLLLSTTPRAARFFRWIMLLLTAIAVVLPLSLDVGAESRVFTAVLNAVIGIMITALLCGVAGSARRRWSA
ncbi:DUF6069 family protein [Actinosynnema sp. NPDC051121]